MKEKLFLSLHYKQFILDQIQENAAIKGYQGKMAKAIRCPASYFSRVLHGKAHLNQEQAFLLTLFWELNELETDYFLELLHLARTDYPLLKKRILRKLEDIRNKTQDLSKRFSKIKPLGQKQEMLYYCTWYPAAIHVLVSIPGYQTVEAISQKLHLSKSIVSTVLTQLENMGLVQNKKGFWTRGTGHTFLSKKSPMIASHHSQWRMKAVEASQEIDADGVHYTSIQSHSVIDFQKIKQVLLSSIEKTREIFYPSENEEITCMTLDFFRV